MELLAVAILILVAVYFLFLRPKKKRPTASVVTPVWEPSPPVTEPVANPEPPLDLSARDRRIVELFALNGEVFTAAKDVSRVSGDPGVASFDSAVTRGVLETGKTPDDRHGYRVTKAALAASQ